MLPAFADPKTDIVFKKLFGEPSHKELLIALLNDLLELVEGERIVDVTHLSEAQKPVVRELKLSIVDVKCRDERGRIYVVEMQVLSVEAFEKRVVYNVAKAYTVQIHSGEHYLALTDVVGVTICAFELWPNGSRPGEPDIPMLSRWRMQEQHSGRRGLPQIQHVFLELQKYGAGDQPQTNLEKWTYFFREAENLEVVPPALQAAPFSVAMEQARVSNMTPQEWELYDKEKMALQDQRGSISLAAKEGEIRGEIRATANLLLTVLKARALVVSDETRQRILECKDAATLYRWHERALVATTIEQIWA